ncbi:MAG TPA: 50S ribosomal protein L17 [Acidobacteriota bacterium]|nr:50S ribosomal protein L17 [Acidobacteriota bacterium]
MRHRWSGRKLGRTTSHRKALLRTMVTQLLEHDKIVTTVPKAKELRPAVERIITLGKRGDLHARRRALAFLRDKSVVHKLFETLGPRYAERPGGYTRIVRLGKVRPGDAGELALLELVDTPISVPSGGKRGAGKAKAVAEPKAAGTVPGEEGATERDDESGGAGDTDGSKS